MHNENLDDQIKKGDCGNVGHCGIWNPLHITKGWMIFVALHLKLHPPYFYPISTKKFQEVCHVYQQKLFGYKP